MREAAEEAAGLAQKQEAGKYEHEFSPGLESVLNLIEDKIGESVKEEQKRFYAVKLLEKDRKISMQMKHVPDVTEEIAAIEKEMDDDTESIIANERYVYISSIIRECYTRQRKEVTIQNPLIQR